MATSMNYSVVARKNPSKKSEPAKYYALAQARASWTSTKCAKR